MAKPVTKADIYGIGCTSCVVWLVGIAVVVLVISLVIKVVFGL